MARVIHNSKVLIQNVQLRMKKNRLNQQQGLLEVNCFIRIQLTGKKDEQNALVCAKGW